MAGEIKASPRNRTLGKVADKLIRLKALANKYEVLPQVPLLGGTGIGDLLMGEAPEEVNNWSYGNAPMRIPEMSNIPQMKTGRAQSVADTLFLGADVGALGGLAAQLGRRGLSEFVGSVGRAGVTGPESQLGVIKPKGGNWVGGSIENAVGPLRKDVLNEEGLKNLGTRTGDANLQSYLATRAPDYALNNWIDKTLGKYIKNEMATPEDPVRALAEKGILHTDLTALDGYYTKDMMDRRRANSGYPEGLGTSDLAKKWEDQSDMQVAQFKAGDLATTDKLLDANPWALKVPPETPVYDAGSLDGLGFDHLIDELTNATNPDSGLPRELLLKYDALPRVTVPQAVERVAKINEWRAAQKVLADQGRAMNPATQVFKEYPDAGYKWVELKLPKDGKLDTTVSTQVGDGAADDLMREAENQAWAAKQAGDERDIGEIYDAIYSTLEDEAIVHVQSNKALQDALKYEGETMGHCVGGYCPDVAAGKSQIYSLRDSKGMPHVTVEVQPNEPYFDGEELFGLWRSKNAKKLAGKSDGEIEDAFNDWSNVYSRQKLLDEYDGSNTSKVVKKYFPEAYESKKIPRITQIKGKGNAAPKADYLPFVQDFVRSRQWSDVGDLQNTGLIDLKNQPKRIEALGSRFVSEKELNDYLDSFGDKPQNFAQGGLVTQYDPARIEALVSQLMDGN